MLESTTVKICMFFSQFLQIVLFAYLLQVRGGKVFNFWFLRPGIIAPDDGDRLFGSLKANSRPCKARGSS